MKEVSCASGHFTGRKVVEAIRWSSRKAIDHLVVSAGVGLSVGLLLGLPTAISNGVIAGLHAGVIAGLVFGGGLLLLTPFNSIVVPQLAEQTRLIANQGIWRSAWNGLMAGALTGLGLGVVFGLLNGSYNGLLIGTGSGIFFGVLFSLIFGLSTGLSAFLRHFVLRFWLWRSTDVSLRLIPLLDEATERLLLRKVGGGYIFIHRLLLEYFASLKTTSPSQNIFRSRSCYCV